jgi:amino acid transporter
VLGGTTSLLLLAVFAVVNVAVLVLRRDVKQGGGHFKTPTVLPVIGFVASLYLVTPLSGRPAQQYIVAGGLIALGVLLWAFDVAYQPSARNPHHRDHRPDAPRSAARLTAAARGSGVRSGGSVGVTT